MIVWCCDDDNAFILDYDSCGINYFKIGLRLLDGKDGSMGIDKII